jgi:hypothetical protein
METKICGRCKELKDICFFGVNKQTKSGYRSTCNDCRRIESREYKEKNPEKRKETLKKYYVNNKETELTRFKLYIEKNPDKRKKTVKKYYENNKKIINKKQTILNKKYYNNNYYYKLKHLCRSRLCEFLKTKNITKQNKTFEIVGCSPQFLKEYLEKKFTEGMSWDNHGLYGWHIDHIIPLSSVSTEEEIYKLCHYTNLQPLWATDNLKKGSKLI